MVKCADCEKEIPESHNLYCDMYGAQLCEECGNLGLCSTSAELWEAETDLEDMAEEEWQKQKKGSQTGDETASSNETVFHFLMSYESKIV